MFAKSYQALKALLFRNIRFDLDLIPYEFKDLPLRKLVNWLLTETSVIFKPARPWGFPTLLQVEPTNHCNLRCTGCPVTSGMDRPKGMMDLNLYKSMIDELKEYLLLIMLWDWGEPFLHPDAYEMIRYTIRSGIKVLASTNGNVFCEGDHARNVVESGLDVLVFSVDGITQETYSKYRNMGELQKVLEGIKRVVAEKERQSSRTPLINFRFIAMKHNEDEMPLLRGFAESLNVDALTIRKFREWGNQNDLVPEAEGYQLPSPSSDESLSHLKNNPCKRLWNCPTIHWNGSVCPCFVDYNEATPLGDIGSASFKNIWYGEAFNRLRRRFRDQWRELPLCGTCSYGYEGGDVGREADVKAVFFDKL